METLECFNSYSLNTNFKTLLTESIPGIYGIDKTTELYKVCGIAPENLDPFQYRDRFFVKGETTNILSTDTNANVSGNSIVQYQDEVHKGLNKLITYNTLYSKLEEYYDTETANTCLKLLLNGTLFLNDSISFDLPYCYGFDLTCLLEGLTVSNNQVLKMRPAKHSRTFISQFIQLLAVASAELLGACAFPNFFVLLDWFYRKEFGDAYVFSTKTNKSILQDFQHIIYSVNWNFRRSQTAFTNLSALDFGFLKEIFGDYVYPDFTKVNFVSVRALSMEFFEYFEELYGKDGVPTFPVMTLACSLDRKTNEMIDPEFFDWACEINHRKSIANVLLTTPDSFSSCCFDGEQKVLTSNQELGINLRPIKEVVEDSGKGLNTNFKVYHNGNFVKAKKVKVKSPDVMYQITTSKNTVLKVTPDHLHPTDKGLVKTEDLTTDHYLATSGLPFLQTSDSTRGTSALTYEQGVLIGTYLGDGYKHLMKNGQPEVSFALSDKKLHLVPLLKKALRDYGVSEKLHIRKGEYNVVFCSMNSQRVYDIINTYVSGSKALTKKLVLDTVLRESVEFREGIKFGWLSTDGSNGNRLYTSSQELLETGQVLLTSLGYTTHIWEDQRIDKCVTIRGIDYTRNEKVKCLKWQRLCSKRKDKDIFKIINNTIFIKIKDICTYKYNDDYVYCFEMLNEEEPYFTLPNGIITHNCRLKNELSAFEDIAETKNYGEEGFQNSFGVGSVSVGSHRVCGINLPRLPFIIDKDCTLNTLMDCIHKILLTHRRHLQDLIDKGLLPLYQHEVMFLNKQYGTIGFIGVPEFHKNNINNSLDIVEIFNTFERCTKSWKEEDKQFRAVYNIEQIPGEVMASRLATQDTILGYNPLKIELYSNQYIPLTEPMSIEKRLQEQAKYEKYTSGGSILHISMFDNEPLSKEHYKRILQRAYELGVTYIGVNYCYSVCEQKHTLIGSKYDSCPICGKSITDIYTRVVGFITPVKAWGIPRQKEFPNRQSIKTSEFEVL